MKNKLRSFTLMEVTIAMLISAICVTICYTAYGLIQEYYIRLDKKNSQSDHILNLKAALERDFQNSKLILKVGEGISVQQDSLLISYLFSDHYVTREAKELHTDTFDVRVNDAKFYFENSTSAVDTVDRLDLILNMKSSLNLPLRFTKAYSSADLYK